MAVRFDAAADRLLRTATVYDFDTNFSWMGWIYVVNMPAAGNYATIFSINDNSTLEDSLYIKCTAGTTYRLVAGTSAGSYEETVGTTDLSANTWYHVALVRNNTTTLLAYLNGALEVTESHTAVARILPTRMEMGGRLSTDQAPFDGRIAFARLASTNRNAVEILNEYRSFAPRRASSLWHWTPLLVGARTADRSGNGREWTEGGTLADEDDPPGVSYGFVPFLSVPYVPPGALGTATLTTATAALAATGTLPIVGTAALTTGAASVVAVGTLPVVGTAALSTTTATLSAAGTLALAGAAAVTTADATLIGTGILPLAGAASLTAADATLVATGALEDTAISGSAALVTADAALSATGTLPILGTLAGTTGAVGLVASGMLTLTGAAALTTAGAVLSATATVATLSVDPDLTYTVPAETLTYIVPAETLIYMVR